MTIAAHVFLQTLRRIRSAQPVEVRHYQAVMLARLIDFAHRMAPAYRFSLHPLIDGESVALERYETIPVLTRAALERLGNAVQIDDRPEALGSLTDGRPASTTGSPLSGPVDQDFLWADTCVHELLFDDLGLDGRLALAEITQPDLSPAPGATRAGWSFQRPRGALVGLDATATDADLIGQLGSSARDCVALRADLSTLARLAAADAELAPALQAVIGHGSAAAADVAAVRAWATRQDKAMGYVLSTPESGAIATSGPDGALRSADGVAFVEILDDRGRPVPMGQPGRLVSTPLYAYTRPLIRYDSGLTARRLTDGTLELT